MSADPRAVRGSMDPSGNFSAPAAASALNSGVQVEEEEEAVVVRPWLLWRRWNWKYRDALRHVRVPAGAPSSSGAG
ncbi:hypothetical protein ACP70R_045636 [Stipagrostis hirtigluma subsp. patula]